MDNEGTKNLISTMDSLVEHIDEINSYIIAAGLRTDDLILTFSGGTDEIQGMMRAILDYLSNDMDVEGYSHFILQFNIFARRLMERKYGSESELEEEDS